MAAQQSQPPAEMAETHRASQLVELGPVAAVSHTDAAAIDPDMPSDSSTVNGGDPSGSPSASSATKAKHHASDKAVMPSNAPTSPIRPTTSRKDQSYRSYPGFTPTERTNSNVGTLLRRISSRVSGRGVENDDDDASINSFERSVSRRTQAEEDDWSLGEVLENYQRARREAGQKDVKLDVAWHGLCVRGVGADAVFADSLGSMFNPMTKRDDKRRAAALQAAAQKAESGAVEKCAGGDLEKHANEQPLPKLGKNEKFLLRNLEGVLKAGEMALVVRRIPRWRIDSEIDTAPLSLVGLELVAPPSSRLSPTSAKVTLV